MFSHLTILIIDDSVEDREMYKRYLSSLNDDKIYFLECETGDDGLDMLAKEKPDCILLDYNLPDTDGIEFLEQLSKDKTFNLPVIFLTGQGNEMVAVQAMKNGATDYLIKTMINPDLLNRAVQYAIEKKSTGLKLEAYVKELERANQKIIEQQKAVIEEERLKVILQMAGATAHELNQPLMILLNGLEILEDNEAGEAEKNKCLALVSDAGKRIADIVKKIQMVRQYETQAYAGGTEIVQLDQSLNILIVEDTDNDFEMLAVALSGIDTTQLFRGADLDQGYQILNDKQIDLVFCDYFLPSGTALDFIGYLNQKKIEVPVIVVTASGDEMIASRSIQAGACDYMPKTKISGKAVTRVIENTMSRFRVRQETGRAMQEMAKMATQDELTGLYNRRYFDDCLMGEIERAIRYKSSFSIFISDLDYFKKVNDIYGHPAGDTVLQRTAQILKDILRKSDIPCRYGGEEFAVILPNAKGKDCFKICDRFRKTLAEEDIIWENKIIKVTVSTGISSFSHDRSDSTQSLVQRADKALYKSKENGRNMISMS